MVYSVLWNASLSYAHVLINKISAMEDRLLGLTAKAGIESMLGMKYNCCSNVKLYFKNVRVCIRACVCVRPYLPPQ